MADEIRVNLEIQVSQGNSNVKYPNGSTSNTFDQTAQGGPTPGFLTVGTTEESNTFAELSTLGWCVFHNLDATNYIEWGFATGVYGGRLEANEKALFRLNPGTTLYYKANTANCKAFLGAFED